MSFQWVIDNAASISVTTQPTVAQSISRNNRPRAVNRGGERYRFTVQMPAGMRYTDARPFIATYETRGRDTPIFLDIPQSYISGYTGSASSITGWQATFTLGSTFAPVTSTGGASFPDPSGRFIIGGNYVQPILGVGSFGRVYTIIQDGYLNGGAPADPLYLHRPANETGTYEINIGQNCRFYMLATKIPRWEIFDYNLVRWNGEFEFYEIT
jgi:hypothetical protein